MQFNHDSENLIPVGRVVGIMVTYNPNAIDLSVVLKSICSQLSCVVVIDNGSNNFVEIEELCLTFKSIVLLKNVCNMGLAFSQNQGIRYVKDKLNASHVILFDQDSVIASSFVSELILSERLLIDSGKKVAAVGPSFFDPATNNLYPATIYCGPFIKRVDLLNDPVEATFIIASGCLIRVTILDDVGLMKEELFIDYIDVEWSLRAQAKGYGVYIAPKARMAHTIGDSRLTILGRTISVHSPLRRYYLVRNSFFMLRRDYVPWGYKVRELTFNLLRTVIGFFLANQKLIFCKYFSLAIYDGLRGHFGRCPKMYK